MEIKIIITDKTGNEVFQANTKSIDSAIQELGKFERHVLPIVKNLLNDKL
jgi:hypothetical protein